MLVCAEQFPGTNSRLILAGCVMSGERKYGGANQSLVSCKSKSQEVEEARISKRAEDGGGGGGSEYGRQDVSYNGGEKPKEADDRTLECSSFTYALLLCQKGVVDYITELQRVLQSLEAKKRQKVYGEQVTHHWIDSSPQRPPLSPRPSVPISPRTPQPTNTYRPTFPPLFIAPSPTNSFISSDNSNELMANLRSPIAEVEVKFAGGNLLLKICSNRIPGQTTKVIAILENLSFEVLHVDISVVDETMVNSSTIKIGVECRLSTEELAQHIQKTFC